MNPFLEKINLDLANLDKKRQSLRHRLHCYSQELAELDGAFRALTDIHQQLTDQQIYISEDLPVAVLKNTMNSDPEPVQITGAVRHALKAIPTGKFQPSELLPIIQGEYSQSADHITPRKLTKTLGRLYRENDESRFMVDDVNYIIRVKTGDGALKPEYLKRPVNTESLNQLYSTGWKSMGDALDDVCSTHIYTNDRDNSLSRR